MEFPQDKVIKDIDEITDLNKSYIMKYDKKHDNKEKQSQTKRSNKKDENNNKKKGNAIKEDLNQTIYSDGVNTYRGEEVRQAYNKHLENKENEEKRKNASATQHDFNKQMLAFIRQQIAQGARSKESHKYNKSNPLGAVKEKMTNKEKAARERENRKKFGVGSLLHPSKGDMVNYMFTQREKRDFDAKSRQSEINKIYEQMRRKNSDNNISRSSMKTINAQKAKEKGV